jgi:hypothetical protein
MKLTQAQLNELFAKEALESNGAKLISLKQGDWVQKGKWQKSEIIFTNGEKNFKGILTRSGSVKEGWEMEDYGDAEIDEVRKVKKTIDFWEVI